MVAHRDLYSGSGALVTRDITGLGIYLKGEVFRRVRIHINRLAVSCFLAYRYLAAVQSLVVRVITLQGDRLGLVACVLRGSLPGDPAIGAVLPQVRRASADRHGELGCLSGCQYRGRFVELDGERPFDAGLAVRIY